MILGWTEPDVVAVEIAAAGIRRGECTEIVVDSRSIAWVGGVVLRDCLHRPFHGVTGCVFHGGAKSNARGVGIQANRALELNPSPGIGRSSEFYFTVLSFRHLSKGVGPVIQQVGTACPMLFIVVPLWQGPELVAAIVEPLALTRRQVFAFIFRIDEEIGMSGENHLYQSPAVLRQANQLAPAFGKSLRVPALIVREFNVTR